MRYIYAVIIAGAVCLAVSAYAADDSKRGSESFVSNAVSDVVDKVDKVASGNIKIFESVDDYEMSSDGKRIPKKYGDKGKRTALEQKLDQ